MKSIYLKMGLIILFIFSSSCLSTAIKYHTYTPENQDLFDYKNKSFNTPPLPFLGYDHRRPADVGMNSFFEVSQEDQLNQNANFYIKNEDWQKAYDELIKYEPVLTYNREMINKLIFVSIKLEKYSVAEEQIKSILKPKSEWASQINLVKLLAQLAYLDERYDEAQELFSNLDQMTADPKIKSEVKMYTFLIGYKTKNKSIMESALNKIKLDHEAYVRFSLYYIDYLKMSGEFATAFKKIKALYLQNKFETEVALEYVKYLMDENKFKDVLKVIQSIGPDVSPAQYEQAQLALVYVYFKTNQINKFENGLKSLVSIDQKALQSLWLGKKLYSAVYEEIYHQQEKATGLILRNVKSHTLAGFASSQDPEIFSRGKLKIDQSDSVRLPASLEKNQ